MPDSLNSTSQTTALQTTVVFYGKGTDVGTILRDAISSNGP
jgi:hypothetical protein